MTDTPEKVHRGEIVETITLDELVRLCRVDESWVKELVSEGVLKPRGGEISAWSFSSTNIARTQVAWRLYRDLGVNIAGIAIALDLLEERNELYRKLHMLEMFGETEVQ